MTEQKLKEIWLNSSELEKIHVDLTRLIIDLKNQLSTIEKAIRKRDIREIVAAFIGVPVFAYLAYEIPFPMTRIASILTVLWSLYVVYRFKKIQKSKRNEDLTLPFKTQLENQRMNMLEQHHFLNTVLYWYAGPPFFLNTLFIVGLGNPDTIGWSSWIVGHLPLDSGSKIGLIIGLALFYAFIVWLNKRAVKKTLNPLIRDIERIQRELNTTE